MEGGNGETLKFTVQVSHDAKLKELLHKITSIEIKLCSDGTREFIELLKGNGGGELLHHYVRASSKCSEILEAWKLRQGKDGISYIFQLISSILSHYEGKYQPDNVEKMPISRDLDKFARLLVVEYLGDVYKELNSKEAKRQKAALLLMASIVRRGSSLASDVVKNFDFKLGEFLKLAKQKQKRNESRITLSLRKSFVGFAMSFLEVGKPGLLRWVLQQKEMYSGVLRGLGDDDDETVIYVLSTLRDRLLVKESLVPPALRSVLFGSVTLEQLINISGREGGGPAAELAYHVLVMVCTDPSNGLMPDLKMRPVPLRGNPKRIMGLMKKLRATEVQHHRDLLLSIVNCRPSFGLLYLEEFPYNIEDYTSPSWFSANSLAANLVSSVGNGLSMGLINLHSNNQHSYDSMDVQSIMKSVFSRIFSRPTVNKGLLHSDFLVKHSTLRLLLEVLKLLDSLIGALNHSFSSNQSVQHLESSKQEIQNEVQTLLPDPQVLLTLLSSSGSVSKTHDSCLKKTASPDEHSSKNVKRIKVDPVEKDIDIVVGGMSSIPDLSLIGGCGRVGNNSLRADALDDGEDLVNAMAEIWGPEFCSMPITTLKDAGICLHSKLLDALRYYRRIIPHLLDGSFEFFTGLLNNPLELPINLQASLLSLLMEYIEWYPNSEIPRRTPLTLYKHLQPFIKLLIFSSVNGIRDQAYRLSKAAMFSTCAFDKNFQEIGAWLLFLPGYHRKISSVNGFEMEVLQSLCPNVISFLCDAISTVGNNLVKHWDVLKHYLHLLKGVKGVSPVFSPLIVCVLEKCLRLILSKSGTYSLPEKSMVVSYVCNTLKYLLQTQVDAELISALVITVLNEKLGDHHEYEVLKPLKNLLLFAQNISHQQGCFNVASYKESVPHDTYLSSALGEVKRLLSNGDGEEMAGRTVAFISSIICVETDEILKNLPSLMIISHNLRGVPFSILSSMLFHDHNVLPNASILWPEIFYAGLDIAVSDLSDGSRNDSPIRTSGNQHFDITETDAAVAFGLFMKQAPFHVIFPSMMCINGPCSSALSKIQELLLNKLSESRTHCSLLSNLRLVLFWIHQIQSYSELNPLVEVERLSNLCLILVENLVVKLLLPANGSDCYSNSGFCGSSQSIQEVAETIFYHPAVLMSLSFPLSRKQNLVNADLQNNMDVHLLLCRQGGVSQLSNPVLKLLTITLDKLWSLCSGHICTSKGRDAANKELVKAFKDLQQKLFLEVRDKFEQCICSEDLKPAIPTLSTFHALVQFLSPFQLLEIVDEMFSRVGADHLTARKSALSFGCSLAAGAFSTLSFYLQQHIRNRVPYDFFWDMSEKNIDVNIFEKIYSRVVNFELTHELDCADNCLLEAVNVLYKQKHMQQPNFHPLVLALWRIIMVTPVKMISHCIYRTNMKKAKFLYILTEVSPLHLSAFGHVFFSILNRNLHYNDETVALSEDQFMLLLPASLSYLNSISMRPGRLNPKKFKDIPSLYSSILLKGFHQWKRFVSRDIFEEELTEFSPLPVEQFLYCIDGSLLGKSIHMLRYHFDLNGDSIKFKKRLKLFKSICPYSTSCDDLLDCDSGEIDNYSLHQSLNIINRVIAKISLCRMLLFPGEANRDSKDVPSEVENKMEATRIQFICIVVTIWQFIVKKFSLASDQSGTGKCTNILLLYNRLEVFLLRSILELIAEMCDDLIQLQSIPFLEQLIRSALIYRFGDSMTLKSLQVILTLLYEGKLSCDLYLQLLLAHSQFAPTIRSVCKLSGSSTVGPFLKPMLSILKCLVIQSSDWYETDEKYNTQTTGLSMGQLEIIKLLRVLLWIKSHQTDSDSGNDDLLNFKELHSLLCLSYGATLSRIDLEIYKLMQQIESVSGSVSQNVADVNCLWGTAALRVKSEHLLEQNSYSDMKVDSEVTEEWSSQYRENILIDPDLCASTILYFPYDRSACDEPLSIHKIQPENVWKMVEMRSSQLEVREQYDPVFILHFSIHSLSKSYIEALEFASSGLLAIAFVSMSSPDPGIRRLAYAVIDRFKNALENYQKRKDLMRLHLLLSSMQNSIEEPWQRIPSVIALFAAEASCVLLDSSHEHYAAISTFLIQSSRLNMRVIPLFNNFLWSTSVNFKAERLWVLRLVYAGLRSDDDALLYIRNSILENLMSLYVSPLSDFESKELIIEVIRKSVKVDKIARHLVKHCSLFSWFSSLISVQERLYGDENKFVLKQVFAVLQVVNDVILSGNISKWLQKCALEQLMELSSNLLTFVLRDEKLANETAVLVNPFLQMMSSVLKLSQKRKVYQPHFTLSIEGIYKMFQVVNACNHATICINPVFALEAILMNAPPTSIFLMNVEKLESFLMWAAETALKSESSKKLMAKESHVDSAKDYGEQQEPKENSLISKLLRWLTASVIIGKLCEKSEDTKSAEVVNLNSLHSLLEHVQNSSGQRNKSKIGGEELLATMILYLQQLLGINCNVLPSVVSALCILLFGASSSVACRADLLQDYYTSVSSLSLRVRCPPEANPTWRWSFYQPWKDLQLELSDSQIMEEYHACLTLLVIISNVLSEKKLDSPCLSPLEIERCGVFEWETNFLETEC
ncbi:hypothetical protein L6164_029398 [Bauhinia variegata]|uniref:Uncharacterized protein n=1 Tax=Bauhinia variegata TaxID=167791 RepID=A0ACB9L9P3_BAUVA|nr:hypothetical protein L6164_029398 [Bauhinia variegata]